MDGLIDWITHLSTHVLYAALAAIGALENVFPPIPADTVVALGSWLAARGKGSAVLAFVAPVAGNVAGAMGMYFVGRRHGKEWLQRRFPALANDESERRLRALYERYGVFALVLSRFIPGVRAVVPPFAGAMHVPVGITAAAIAIASTVWYGGISYLAFRAGSDWGQVLNLVRQFGLAAAVVAGVLLIVALGVWLARRRSSVPS